MLWLLPPLRSWPPQLHTCRHVVGVNAIYNAFILCTMNSGRINGDIIIIEIHRRLATLGDFESPMTVQKHLLFSNFTVVKHMAYFSQVHDYSVVKIIILFRIYIFPKPMWRWVVKTIIFPSSQLPSSHIPFMKLYEVFCSRDNTNYKVPDYLLHFWWLSTTLLCCMINLNLFNDGWLFQYPYC